MSRVWSVLSASTTITSSASPERGSRQRPMLRSSFRVMITAEMPFMRGKDIGVGLGAPLSW